MRGTPGRFAFVIGAAFLAASPSVRSQVASTVAPIPFADARPILEVLRAELVPEPLRGRPLPEIEARWPGWVGERDAAIRRRVDQGVEDSVAHLVLFGTTFTTRPRPTEKELNALFTRPAEGLAALRPRIDDFMAAVMSPGRDERLQIARGVIARAGIDLTTPSGREQMRRFLDSRVQTVAAGSAAVTQAVGAGDALTTSTAYRDRGLSSDTSLLVDYGIDAALAAVSSARPKGASIRRVAIVGPGLDIADKQWGYDFYPPQTIQPFAVIDSLIRHGLGDPAGLRLTAFDLSPHVIQHLEAARKDAGAGVAYRLVLPRNVDRTWTPGLVAYWQRLGDRVGTPGPAVTPPAAAGQLQVRGVGVRPSVVLTITPRDVNIVLAREQSEKFDLVIATNILLYYDLFEQSLAVSNVASMLAPGGLFLTNTRLTLLPGSPLRAAGYTDSVYTTGPRGDETGDRLYSYER